jgi:hypothetical protein
MWYAMNNVAIREIQEIISLMVRINVRNVSGAH